MINYLPPKFKEYASEISGLYKNKAMSFTLQVTENCCLACSYCYQHSKTSNKMDWNMLKIFIDKLLDDQFDFCLTSNISTIIFEFIGGEPTMEIDLIGKVIDYTISQMIFKHHPWLPLFRCNFCSNGILYFQPNVQSFFKKFHNWCSMTVSIDGNQELHDACRKDLNGKGSYERAISAVRNYRDTYHIELPTKMTIAPENISYLYPAVINLIKENYKHINLNCIYENVWSEKHAEILYKEMIKIGDYLIDNDLYNKINVSLFDYDLFQPIDEDDNDNYCGGVADRMIALDYKGEFYVCIRYMESSLVNKQKPLPIGNVYDGYLSSDEYKKNYQKLSGITRRSQSTDECFYCEIASGCGWCSGYNYEEFGTANKRTTYTCCMHKARARANKYYWDRIRKEKMRYEF